MGQKKTKKLFQIVRVGRDGDLYCGGTATIDKIVNAIRDKGSWASLRELREGIKKWSKAASAGELFLAPSAVIIAPPVYIEQNDRCPNCGSSDCNYSEIDASAGDVCEQAGACLNCLATWLDKFLLVERKLTPLKSNNPKKEK